MGLIGYVLQLVGLITLPVAMLLEMGGIMGRSINLSQMLIALVFGVCAFQCGRFLEGYANRGR